MNISTDLKEENLNAFRSLIMSRLKLLMAQGTSPKTAFELAIVELSGSLTPPVDPALFREWYVALNSKIMIQAKAQHIEEDKSSGPVFDGVKITMIEDGAKLFRKRNEGKPAKLSYTAVLRRALSTLNIGNGTTISFPSKDEACSAQTHIRRIVDQLGWKDNGHACYRSKVTGKALSIERRG